MLSDEMCEILQRLEIDFKIQDEKSFISATHKFAVECGVYELHISLLRENNAELRDEIKKNKDENSIYTYRIREKKIPLPSINNQLHIVR